MKKILQKASCCGCGACVEICPEKAVSMIRDGEGFLYPRINKALCTGCGRCGQVCPLKRSKPDKKENLYFGVQAKDNRIRYSSSSGGFFPLLARYVIEKQGAVYGAGFDRQMKVIHKRITELSQIELIKKSKYVQSDMKGIYGSIENDLKNDRWVLFCGTPCQAQALILFLNRTYEKLIVMDLVCYGVPSPGIWMNYVKFLEKRHKGKMSSFSFRDKRNADNGHTCSYIIDGKEYTYSLYHDFFCKMYFKNNILRPACHNCRFCTIDREADFTIGDFWGIEHIKPNMDDGMGTSLVIVHTDKAKRIWNTVKREMRWFECREEDSVQPRLHTPTDIGRARNRFMLLHKFMPFFLLVRLMNE